MRIRAVLLILLALIVAGGTMLFMRSWLASQRREIAQVTPIRATQSRSVLVARTNINRGQIMRAEDMVWQVWPDGAIDNNYVVSGGPKKPESFAGWVAKDPIGGGEPVTASKIIAPGDRGFLAAVLRPGMRAISVPVSVTSDISGFIFPGDRVDLVLTYPMPAVVAQGPEAPNRPSFEHKVAATVLRDIRVIAIDQRLESKPGEAVVARTATFEVTSKEGEMIALATEIGKMSLTLRSLVPAPVDTASNAKVADATSAPTADVPDASKATYTFDSDFIPLLPKAVEAKDAHQTAVVTVFRGSKPEQIKISEPATN